jgi:HSP20 family protein
MAIVKWDPMRELQLMQEQMNRLFEMSRERSLGEPLLEEGIWQPPVDIYEDDQEVVVKMEVPEVEQKDVDVQIEDALLIIQGERKLEREEKKHNYHRIERCYGHFRRTFTLPATVDQARVSATCNKGVLKVVLPKKSPRSSKQIEVEVK